MVDETPQQAESEEGAAPADAAGGQPQTRTPEQVEAEWQAKQSALGRQHAATEKNLRDRIAALEAESKASGSRTDAENDVIKQENEALRKQLAEQATAHVMSLRQARYPAAAEALDKDAFVAMDEAKLAGLEARLTPEAPPQAASAVVLASTPPRDVTPPKPASEKTSEELKRDLARMAPEYLSRLHE